MLPRLPPQCAARYRLGEPIAHGGCGSVYHAVQIQLERPVAIKLLHPEVLLDPTVVERFQAEARVTAQLAHPHIVKVLDFDVEEGTPWIAYELVLGPSLRARVKGGMTRWPMAVRLVSQIASALAAAHEEGVMHRDVKPENVLEARPGYAKVTDFGIARVSEAGMNTQVGFIMGTPAYVSPEMARGRPASPSSDLYALGVTLFELLAARRPFHASTVTALLTAHVHEPVPRLDRFRSDLPPALVDLGARLLAKTPAERPASALALAAELDRLIANVTDTSTESLMPVPMEVLRQVALPEDDAVTPATLARDLAASAPTALTPLEASASPPVLCTDSTPPTASSAEEPEPRVTPRPTSPVTSARPVAVTSTPRLPSRSAFAAGLAAGLACVIAAFVHRQTAPERVTLPPATDATVATSDAVLERQHLELDATDHEQETIKPLLMLGSRDGQEKAARLARLHGEIARDQLTELDAVLARLGSVEGAPLPRAVLAARVHGAQIYLRLRADRLQQRARMADRARAEQLEPALGLGRILEMDHEVQYDAAILPALVGWCDETDALDLRIAESPTAAPAEVALLYYDPLRIADQLNVYHFRGDETQARLRAVLANWKTALLRDLFEIGLAGDAARDPARLARVLAALDRVQSRMPRTTAHVSTIRASLEQRIRRR